MFRKRFFSIESLKHEILARNKLKNQFVTTATHFSYENRTILFENHSYINLDELVKCNSENIFSENMIYVVTGSLCEAIKHLNKNGIIHLDLKPSNILIDKDYNVKLNDFEDYVDVSKPLQVLPVAKGNFLYRPPERDTTEYGVESNIFSLGLLIYYLVHGHHPYIDLNQDEIIEWKKSWKIEYSPIIHPLLSYLIDNCINPDPTKRFIYDIRGEDADELTFDELHAFTLMYKSHYIIECDPNYVDDPRQAFLNVANSFLYFPGQGLTPEDLLYLKRIYNECADKSVIIYDSNFCCCSFNYYKLNLASDNQIAISRDDLLYGIIMDDSLYDNFISDSLYNTLMDDSFMNYIKKHGIGDFNEDDFLEVSATLTPQILSYQMLVGKGVAFDVIEGTYKCITSLNFDNDKSFSYYFTQPIIMAHFTDSAELLCLDYYYYKDLITGYAMPCLFDFIAPNEYDIRAFCDFVDEHLGKDNTFLTKVVFTMTKETLPNCNFYYTYFSYNDFRLSIEGLINLAPNLTKYFRVCEKYLNFNIELHTSYKYNAELNTFEDE